MTGSVSVLKPCISCGELSAGPYCDEHRPAPKPTPASPRRKHRSRDYDHQWKQLSKRARRTQPFCLWCGNTDDLQTDHTPQAWERKQRGLPLRLEDVRVLCGTCNRLAGQARPGVGQRTSEDRPKPVDPLPATGTHLTSRSPRSGQHGSAEQGYPSTQGGRGQKSPGPARHVRQSLSNSLAPATGAVFAQW